MKWYQDPITVATIVIAISTVVSVVVSYYAWKATKLSARAAAESAEITKLMFEEAYRPRVAIIGVQSSLDPQGKKAKLTVALKNYGTLPARHIELLYACSAEENSDHGLQSLMPQEITSRVITLQGADFDWLMDGKTLKLESVYFGAGGQKYRYDQHMAYRDGVLSTWGSRAF